MISLLKWLLKRTGLYGFVIKVYDWANLWKQAFRFVQIFKLLPDSTKHFFFFPFYHVGGAEKVHLDIVKAVKDHKPVVFFTSPSSSNALEAEFKKCATCFYIYPVLRSNGFLAEYVTKAIANRINHITGARVFSSNCRYYYSLIPRLSKQVVCIDLIHAFVHEDEVGAEHWSLPLVSRINKRVVIVDQTKELLKQQYTKNELDKSFLQRIILIKNYVSVPAVIPEKNYAEKLVMVFVSRNSPEKRIPQVGAVAARLVKDIGAEVHLVGNGLVNAVCKEDVPHLIFHGEVNDINELNSIYAKAHLFFLLSSREGMPITILEAMANGCAVVSTSVGGIAGEVEEGINGVLVPNGLDDKDLEEFAVKAIKGLNEDRALLKSMGQKNYAKAKSEYSEEEFKSSYRSLLV